MGWYKCKLLIFRGCRLHLNSLLGRWPAAAVALEQQEDCTTEFGWHELGRSEITGIAVASSSSSM